MDAETHTHVCIYIYDYMCVYANRMYVFLRLYSIYVWFIVYTWPRSRSRPKHRCQTRCSADSWIDCSKWNQNSRAKILEPKSKKEMIKASINFEVYLWTRAFQLILNCCWTLGIQDYCYISWPEQLPLCKLRKQSFRLINHGGLTIFIWDWHL